MKTLIDPREAEYQKLRELSIALKVPIFEAHLEIEITVGGKIVHHHRQRSHSWVRNVYNGLFCSLAAKDASDSTIGAGLLSYKETDGTTAYGAWPGYTDTSVTNDGVAKGYRAAAAEDGWGILVGSGTDAESFEDYVLQTPIAEGTGAGELSYVQSEANVVTYVAGTKTMTNTLIRYFNNNSGAGVAVNEVALVVRPYGNINVLASRDKLSSTETVANTGQLKVTYTISLVYAG